MGDKKAKRGKADGKTAKLPKRIGGVKLPKDLRKSANLLLETASNPVGRELLVSGAMAMVANAAARRPASTSGFGFTPPPVPPRPGSPAPDLSASASPASDPRDANAAPMPPDQVIGLLGGAMLNVLRDLASKRRD